MLDLTDILAGIEKRMGFCDPELSFRPNLERFVDALNCDNRL